MFETYLKWIGAHEKLLLVAVAGVVLWFGIGKIDTLIANHDQANLAQAKVIAAQDASKTEAIAAQVAQQAAQYQALAAKLDAQNAALVAVNTQLATALAKQQKTDATLSPTELTNRWNALVPNAGASTTPTGVTLPSVGAVATVQQLEEVPVLNAQLSNTNVELENADKLVAAEGQQIVTLNTEVTSLKTQLVDNQKVCTAQITVVKAQAAKSKRRWFIVGYIAGFLSRQYIKTATGF